MPWHETIYTSLLRSCFDVYGQIDAEPARAVLSRLRLPADTQHLDRLREALAAKK